jgi:hypothetical protein
VRRLIRDLIPHAPELGLHVDPYLNSDLVRNAVRDYAPDVDPDEVVALYDATMLRNAKDGAVFTEDRFVFQNHDLHTPETVRYEDVVRVNTDRKLLGGRKVVIDVNRGRATTELTMDFSGKPGAAAPIARFLSEAMLVGVELGSAERSDDDAARETDREAVLDALEALHRDGKLSTMDLVNLRKALG